MFTQQGPYGREPPSPKPMIYSFILSESPFKEPSHEMGTYGHRPRSPTRTEDLHTMMCGLVLQGDRLRHSYRYPSAVQPSVRYLPPWLG
jgi:hypothetical protein